jgi:hypothetical protein
VAPELTSYFRSLPDTEAAALDAARSGRTSANCANCCARGWRRGRPAQAAALLRDWIGTGLITATG